MRRREAHIARFQHACRRAKASHALSERSTLVIPTLAVRLTYDSVEKTSELRSTFMQRKSRRYTKFCLSVLTLCALAYASRLGCRASNERKNLAQTMNAQRDFRTASRWEWDSSGPTEHQGSKTILYRLDISGRTELGEALQTADICFGRCDKDSQKMIQLVKVLPNGVYNLTRELLLRDVEPETWTRTFEKMDIVPGEYAQEARLGGSIARESLVVRSNSRLVSEICKNLTMAYSTLGYWLDGSWIPFGCDLPTPRSGSDPPTCVHFHFRGDSVLRDMMNSMCAVLRSSPVTTILDDFGRAHEMHCCSSHICLTWRMSWFSADNFIEPILSSANYCRSSGDSNKCIETVPTCFLETSTKPYTLFFMGSHDPHLGCTNSVLERIQQMKQLGAGSGGIAIFGTPPCVASLIPKKFGHQFIMRNSGRVSVLNHYLSKNVREIEFVDWFLPLFAMSTNKFNDAVHFDTADIGKSLINTLLGLSR